jgi:hypothetical protein
VVDQTIKPVAGAIVDLPGPQAAVTTDADGNFAFDELVAGAYFIVADAPGYDRLGDTVQVEAGKTTQLKVILTRTPVEDPYHFTQPFDGYADVALDPYTTQFTRACSQCDFRFTLDKPATSLVLEAYRESRPETSAGSDQFEVRLLNGDGSTIFDAWMDDPFVLELNGTRLFGQTQFALEIVPLGWYAPEVDVAFEVFVTSFYNGPAPPGWSFIGGDV